MTIAHWLLYLVAAAGLSLTPGPNGLLTLTSSATYGFRLTVFTVLGGVCGFFVLIAASLAGLGALLAASAEAFAVAKAIGCAYLIYLGARLWRSPAPIVAARPDGERSRAARPAALFSRGFLVAVSNPKAFIFFAAFLPQFVVPGVSYAVHLAVFGGTFVVVEIVYELTLAGLTRRIAPWLARYGRWFNRVTGGVFIGLGAVLATADRGT